MSTINKWILDNLSYNENQPLLFTQIYFWVFLTIILLGYSFVYKKNGWRNLYLFLFSLFFYYKSGGYYFVLLIFSTLVDYCAGLWIAKSKTKTIKQLGLLFSLISNLGLLAYFKYFYLIVDTLNQIFGTHFQVKNHLADFTNNIFNTSFDVSNIILPVGISFFTFQTMSYTIDVYRGKIQPVKNIIDFAFYVTFFPQLVAGPIVRASEFIPQLIEKYHLTKAEFSYALFLIINGLTKKMIISDIISINFVDRVFENPGAFSGFENVMAIYGYAIQIYCDFSGYTDIAIGVALLLGFRLPINFNSPYKAKNITDFWRRWHISLSAWLRDYLYISLGGNRKGKVRQYLNLMITMLLGGLWHGANLKFVVWGGIHGIALALHKILLQFNIKLKNNTFLNFMGIFITFHLVCFSWIFFRASDFSSAFVMIQQIFSRTDINLVVGIVKQFWLVFTLILFAYVIHWLPAQWKEYYRGYFIKTPMVVKFIFVVFFVLLLYQATTSQLQPFIYFQF